MNCDTDKGRFLHELRSTKTFHSLHWIVIKQLPTFSYTFVSHNNTASTGWIYHILCLNSNLLSSIEILYGESCHDHIPINCELKIYHSVEFTIDELTQTGDLKPGILWNQVTDEQFYLYRNNLKCISIYLWEDLLSCHSVECDSNFQYMRLDHL